MKNNETKKGYPASPQDSQQENQFKDVPSDVIIPYEGILPKNRMFGRIEGHLEHNQIVAFNVFLYSAYMDLLKNPNQTKFMISIKDFCNLAKLDYETYHSHLFTDYQGRKSIKRLLKELQTKTYEVEWRDEKDEPYRVLSASLLSQFIMDRDKDYIEFAFPPFFRDNLLVSGDFYLLYLPVLGELRGSYAPRLYEQILQRRGLPEWRIKVEDLRKILGIEQNEYKDIWGFHRKVLYPAIKIINKVTEIDLKVSKLKQGRNIIGYRFTWDNNAFEKIYKKYNIPKPDIREEMPDRDLSDELNLKPAKIVNTNEPQPVPKSISQPEQEQLNQQINELLQIYPRIQVETLKDAIQNYGYEKVRIVLYALKEIKTPINTPEAYFNTLLKNGVYASLQELARKEQEKKEKAEQERKEKQQREEQERKRQALDAWWEKEIEKYISRMDETQRKMLRNEAKRVALFKYHFKSEKDIPTISIEIEEKAIIKEQLQAEGVEPPEDL